MLIEVCVESYYDCILAQKLGADRIELNSGLYLGGLTPSLANLILAKKNLDIPIITMVRPRGGDFIYSQYEKEVMIADGRILLENGADGLAFGGLTVDSHLDLGLAQAMIALCREFDADSVFHRAIDRCQNYSETIEQLINLGCQRILTSGQAERAQDGQDLLAKIINQYSHLIDICIGSGLGPDNVVQLVKSTKTKEIHGSFSEWVESQSRSSSSVNFSYSSFGNHQAFSESRFSQVINKLKSQGIKKERDA